MKLKGSPWMLLFILLHVTNLSLGAALHGDALTFDASYKAEMATNLAGGVKRGTSFLGLADLGVELHSDGLGWWKGTSLHLSGQASHGGQPSVSLIGDLQMASNIEAGSHVYLEEAWIRQDWGRFSLQAGLMDLNADYSVCGEAGAFLNSSFGTHAILAINAGAPVFPLTGLGLNAQWRCREHITWQAGIYEGAVTPFEEGNKFNLKHQLSKKEGYLLISELQTGFQHMKFKIGGHGHTGLRN